MEMISDYSNEYIQCMADDAGSPGEHEKIPEFYRLGQYPYDPTPPADCSARGSIHPHPSPIDITPPSRYNTQRHAILDYYPGRFCCCRYA